MQEALFCLRPGPGPFEEAEVRRMVPGRAGIPQCKMTRRHSCPEIRPMAEVLFFQKFNDPANSKQKAQLEAAGHTVVARDLLSEPWTPETLRPWFEDRPVEDWFNRFAPAVRGKTIFPSELDETAALAAMIADPELIRRPLIQVGDKRAVGFDPTSLNSWISLVPVSDGLSCEDKHAQGRCDHGHGHHHH
jgi:nitrogenase-associated protein